MHYAAPSSSWLSLLLLSHELEKQCALLHSHSNLPYSYAMLPSLHSAYLIVCMLPSLPYCLHVSCQHACINRGLSCFAVRQCHRVHDLPMLMP